MMHRKAAVLAIITVIPAGCGSVEIGNVGGCYEIDDRPAFRLDGGYGVHADGRLIGRVRLSDTNQGSIYTARPRMIAVAGEDGYSVRADSSTPEAVGFVDQTLFGSVYFEIPTDAEPGGEEPETAYAYRNEDADC